jgi:hypothetical protein
MTDQPETVKLRTGQMSWRIIDGRVVVLDLAGAEYFTVNETGAAVWDLIVGGARRDDLVDALVERYGIDRATANDDVIAFIRTMRERGLLSD